MIAALIVEVTKLDHLTTVTIVRNNISLYLYMNITLQNILPSTKHRFANISAKDSTDVVHLPRLKGTYIYGSDLEVIKSAVKRLRVSMIVLGCAMLTSSNKIK